MSRTNKSLLNALTGVIGIGIKMLCRFSIQTIFVYVLGAKYVGLQGFLQNVISFLGITELGVGTAIVYSLYRVIADRDTLQIAAIMRLYRKIYFYMGGVIVGIASILVVFLPYLIKNINEFPHFWLIYILYIIDTLLTYWFFSYRNAILQADQRQYVTNLITMGVQLISAITQVCILYITQSFVLFLSIGIACKLLGNFYLKIRTDSMYPYLSNAHTISVPKEVIQNIIINVKAIVIYNGGSKINIFLDTMLISYYLTIIGVAKYTNYILIFSAFSSLLTTFFSAFTASLGNLYIEDSKEKNEFIFRCLNQVNFIFAGVIGITVAVCLHDLIIIWIGDFYLFPSYIHYFLIFSFFSGLLGLVVAQFRNAYGLFDRGKYRPLVGTILSAIMSIVLAPRFGILGIVLGSCISNYATFWWFDSWLVYKYGFNKSVYSYYINYIKDMLYILVVAIILLYITDWLFDGIEVTIGILIEKFFIAFLGSIGALVAWYFKSTEFIYLRSSIKKLLVRLGNKFVRSHHE